MSSKNKSRYALTAAAYALLSSGSASIFVGFKKFFNNQLVYLPTLTFSISSTVNVSISPSIPLGILVSGSAKIIAFNISNGIFPDSFFLSSGFLSTNLSYNNLNLEFSKISVVKILVNFISIYFFI